MDRFELVEKLVKSTGVSFADAKTALEASGWEISDKDIQRDLKGLLGGEFETFCGEESQNK